MCDTACIRVIWGMVFLWSSGPVPVASSELFSAPGRRSLPQLTGYGLFFIPPLLDPGAADCDVASHLNSALSLLFQRPSRLTRRTLASLPGAELLDLFRWQRSDTTFVRHRFLALPWRNLAPSGQTSDLSLA